MVKKEKDEVSGVETTGHEWDGIRELNKPAPRWWLVVWLLCIVWAFGYWVFYPTWPTPEGNSKGSLGWTQIHQLFQSQEQIGTLQSANIEKIKKASLQEIQQDKTLYDFAIAGGASAYKQNCAVCHGSGAAGGIGFPNLRDDDWLWGGKLEDIYKTLVVGIRANHPNTRNNMMPSFGRDGLLTHAQILDVAEYTENLYKGDKAEKTEAYLRGKEIYKNNCTACHGAGGQGNRELGAPAHNDAIWLYGGDKKSIINSINYAHAGVMPSWQNRLSDETIKQLTIYVHSLGGGE